MGILVLVMALFSADTAEFRNTANKQIKDGYSLSLIHI